MAETAYERFLDRLVSVTGYCGREHCGRLSTRCPAHEDRSPSLSVRQTEDRVLVYCFSGCSLDEILAALDLTRRDLFDEPHRAAARRPAPRRTPDTDPGWTYVCEPPDDPYDVRRTLYLALSDTSVGNHPGGPVPPW